MLEFTVAIAAFDVVQVPFVKELSKSIVPPAEIEALVPTLIFPNTKFELYPALKGILLKLAFSPLAVLSVKLVIEVFVPPDTP